ncbi:lipopolysaccharide biosynthesis protein [Mycolicibacterium litorale]|uniref:lipopolysaccharide biosynthesis protein n=1 Tax=Mycolicibacterium litorale TaxID=758802 RepID=UPI0039A20494
MERRLVWVLNDEDAIAVARLGTSGKAAATYILLAGLQRGISLLILPFVTHAMSPEEYGAASILVAASMCLTAVIAAPLIQLIFRAAARGEDDGPALLRAAGTYCYFVLPALVAVAAGVVALFVPRILGVAGVLWGIELLAIGLQPAAATFAMWVAQARADLSRFVWLSGTSVAIMAVSKLVFVVLLGMGVLGWVISDLIAAAFSAVLAMAIVRLPPARVNRQHIRYVLNFSVPLIPHNASLWALTSLSRPALAAVSDLDQVGLLSLALNLASVAILVLTESNRAALVHYSRETLPAPTGETEGTVRWQLIAALLVPAVVGCGVAAFGRWLFAEEYWPSLFLTGVILVGQAAYGLYLIPMNYLTQTAGLPRYSSVASGSGALIILILILLLGNRYGATGVAYVTVAGYLVMATSAFLLLAANRVDIRWRTWLANWPEVTCAAAALICSVAALAVTLGSLPAWILIGVAICLVAGSVGVTARRMRS